MEGRQERVEPLDFAHNVSSLSGEVEAVARGDRSMQRCRSVRWWGVIGSCHRPRLTSLTVPSSAKSPNRRLAERTAPIAAERYRRLCCVGCGAVRRETAAMRTAHRSRRSISPHSDFAGFRFPSDVIVLAVRRYVRFGLSYRDVEELLTERGVEVDHVTIYRWVQRFTPLLAEAARPCRHRWEIAGRWMRRM